jgi:phage N-6-adenine-methyltransferase
MNAAVTKRSTGSQKSSLELIENARASLAKARKLDDVKNMADAAEALRAMLARKAKGTDAHAEAWAFQQEATRRIGELTRKLPRSKQGRPAKSKGTSVKLVTKKERLASVGISQQDAHRAERIASLPQREFRSRIDAGKGAIKSGKRAKPLTAASSASDYDGDEYSTPSKYIEGAREVLGVIELDPASNATAANVVRALRFYTKQENGLSKSWKAKTVWLNPPYSEEKIKAFVSKLLKEQAKHGFACIVLTNCDSGTSWWQKLASASKRVCFPDHRIAFLINGKPYRGNRAAQTFFYIGPDAKKFDRVFRQFGVCMSPTAAMKRAA